MNVRCSLSTGRSATARAVSRISKRRGKYMTAADNGELGLPTQFGRPIGEIALPEAVLRTFERPPHLRGKALLQCNDRHCLLTINGVCSHYLVNNSRRAT